MRETKRRYRVISVPRLSDCCERVASDTVTLRSWTARELNEITSKDDPVSAQIAYTLCDEGGRLLYTYNEAVLEQVSNWDAAVMLKLNNAIEAHCLDNNRPAVLVSEDLLEQAEKNCESVEII